MGISDKIKELQDEIIKEEIRGIKEKYETEKRKPQLSDLNRLRKLDENTHKPAEITSLVVGIIGALMLGFGMCICLGALQLDFYLGLIFGILGIVICAGSYFLYNKIFEICRKKRAPEIISLSNSLLDE